MGGGGDLFDINDPLGSVANIAANVATFGAFGFDNGQFGNGVTSNAVRNLTAEAGQGVKQITGAAAQEEALKQQQAELNRARAEQRQARADEIERRRRQELSASRAAQVMSRNTSNFYAAPTQTTLGAEDSQMLGV